MRFPEELHKSLKKEADRRGMTLNSYVISVLWEQIQNQKKKAGD